MTFKDRFTTLMKAAGFRSVRHFVTEGLGWDPASGPQRMSNYLNGREIDPATLRQIATALKASPSDLVEPVEDGTREILTELLVLEGIPHARADTIASVVFEARRLLERLPETGEQKTRAQLAAHAAWQQRRSPGQDT